jgi:hypothetical protein
MEDQTFQNVMAVVSYLKAGGWKVGKSSVFAHAKQGRLRPHEDGTFHEKDVKKYARTFLKRLDPGTMQPAAIEKLQRRKVEAEAKKLEAQATHWQLRSEIESGRFIPKADFEMELAGRAALFKNDIEYFCMAEAPEIINFVNGDIGKVSELITYLLKKTSDWLNRYAENKEWEVPPGVFVTNPEDREGAEDMERDDESE